MIYYFVANLTEIDPKTEIEIKNDLRIKKVPSQLQNPLKNLIKRFKLNQNTPHIGNDFNDCYYEFKKIKDLPSGGVSIKQRDFEDFRYFVLEEANSRKYNLNYSKAFLLSDGDFFIPFAFNDFDNGISIRTLFSDLSIHTFYTDINPMVPLTQANYHFKDKTQLIPTRTGSLGLNEYDLNQIVENLKLLNEFENVHQDYPNIKKALNDFFSLQEVSDYSPFKIVCYIACLELLLVDDSQEKIKSINKQLQDKINLLNNQFDKPIQLETYIKGPNTLTLGKVVETIYNLRSSIAHGNILDFNKKLNILSNVNQNEILSFLRLILKKCLLYSLENPKLVYDLKKC